MDERKGDWCQTFTGRAVYPLDMRPEDVCLVDIAHALAMQCRFAGHCREFYSVAQHSLLVCDEVIALGGDEDEARWGLLHDASEAYLVDLPAPVKRSVSGYTDLEARAQAAIALHFGLVWPFPAVVNMADLVLLATEARDLMAPPPQAWRPMPPPRTEPIGTLSWLTAQMLFLERCAELGLDRVERACGW